jgi:MFS family permease
VVEHSPVSRLAHLGPLAEPQFRRLYLARAFSLFGDALVPVALAFAVLAVDRSPTALGFVLASRFVSLVVFLLVGGVIGDRLSRKGVLIASDLVRFGAQSITAWLLITAHAMVWELVALAFVYGMGEAFFRPTSTGFVPETVSQARLQQANALLAVTTNTWTVVGPVVAGVMVATVGAGWAIGADALTFLVSALFVWRIRSSRSLPRRESTFFRDLADGWQVFTSQTWLWVDGVFSAISNCVVLAPLLALGPVVALRSLGGAASWATIVAALGIGSTLGGLALLRVTPSRPLLLGVPLLALLALPTALLAVPASTVVIAVGALAGGFGLAVFNTLFETTVQHHVAPDALSRVSSIDWLMSVGLFPLGLAVAGPAAAAFGVRLPLVIAAVWIVASTLIVLAVPSVRHIRLVRSTEPSGRVGEAEPRESLSNPASLE